MIFRNVIKFKGDKPDLGKYVKITEDGCVRGLNIDDDMSMTIGYRVPEKNGEVLADDEIFIRLMSYVYNRDGFYNNVAMLSPDSDITAERAATTVADKIMMQYSNDKKQE